MTSLRSYKFLVAPVVQVVDDQGNVTGEVGVEQPDQIFGVQGLLDYAERFDEALAEKTASLERELATRNGGTPDAR